MALEGLPHRVLTNLQDGQANWEWLRGLQLDAADLGPDSVGSEEIADDAVGTSELATGHNFYDYGFVTALPSSPTPLTGYVCTFTDSLTAPTYHWRLQYLSTDSGSYDWQYVGGTPKLLFDDDSRTITSTTSAAVPTDPMSFTIPLAGDYRARIGSQMAVTVDAVGRFGIHTLSLNGAAGTSAEGVLNAPDSTGSTLQVNLISHWVTYAGLSASDTLDEHAFKAVAANVVVIRRRTIEVMPVRVG